MTVNQFYQLEVIGRNDLRLRFYCQFHTTQTSEETLFDIFIYSTVIYCTDLFTTAIRIVGQLEDCQYAATVFLIRFRDQLFQTVPVLSYPVDRNQPVIRQFELFLQIVFKLDGAITRQAFVLFRIAIRRGITGDADFRYATAIRLQKRLQMFFQLYQFCPIITISGIDRYASCREIDIHGNMPGNHLRSQFLIRSNVIDHSVVDCLGIDLQQRYCHISRCLPGRSVYFLLLRFRSGLCRTGCRIHIFRY